MNETLALVVLAGLALGLAAFALWYALDSRRIAREALDGARKLASIEARRRRAEREAAEAPEGLDERAVDLGAPSETPERRSRDLGATARVQEPGRHRDPVEDRARRRDADDPQYGSRPPAPVDDTTREVPAIRPEDLETAEHPAPTSTYRRPPPALPRPGSIGRQ